MKTTYFANVMTLLPLLVIAVLSLFLTGVRGQGFVCCSNPACQPARKGCNPCQLVFGNDCGGLGGCSSSSGCAAEAMSLGLLAQSQEEKSEANVKVKKDGLEA